MRGIPIPLHLDVGDRLAVDEIGDVVALPDRNRDGKADSVDTMKNVGQPIDCASTPASGPTHTRPIDANALKQVLGERPERAARRA